MQCWKLSRNTGCKHLMIQVTSTNQITEFRLTRNIGPTSGSKTRSLSPGFGTRAHLAAPPAEARAVGAVGPSADQFGRPSPFSHHRLTSSTWYSLIGS